MATDESEEHQTLHFRRFEEKICLAEKISAAIALDPAKKCNSICL